MDLSMLLLGGSGMLGSFLANEFSLSKQVLSQARSNECLADFIADLNDKKETQELFAKVNSEVVVNLVANADVDDCETPQKAYLGNVNTIENIVAAIKLNLPYAYLINISTDHVYDFPGESNESDINLCNYYAFSKYAGELVASQYRKSCSLRTNFFGKSQTEKLSFTDWLHFSVMSGDEIKVFNDVYFNPVRMKTLSSIVEKISEVQPSGIFNVGSNKGMSKAEFAYSFIEELNLPTSKITSCSVSGVKTVRAERPKDMRMNVGKLENLLGEFMPSLEEEIIEVCKEYRDEN